MGVTVGKPERSSSTCFADQINGNTNTLLDMSDCEFDLFIIGGGSGGLAAAKQAAKFGKRVALCDFVKPSPFGTAWGLGGTCVNVGCIPKKLMHQSALLGQAINDSRYFGWENVDEKDHNWDKMVRAIQKHIHSLNWGYKVTLQNDSVTYFNAFAEFVDRNTVLLTNKKEEQFTITSNHFLIAVGGRPRYLDIPGGQKYEHCITSDDLFSLRYNPGKTLLIGASYIALECAGFLAGLGIDTTVMVRSVLLRGFDQQMAEMIGIVLQKHCVRMLRGWIPEEIQKLEEGEPPNLFVIARSTDSDDIFEDTFNTIILAVGREPCTQDMQLQNAGVILNEENNKIITDEAECTNISNIFAIGDVADGRPELTPVAIEAGVLLVKRLYGGQDRLTDYDRVATTVFTPLEYGCIGFSEEDAIEKYGESDIEVYHLNSQPLEFTLPARDKSSCYSKLVCVKSENERVVGFHYLGPNAGEITQGFSLAIKMNATKADFDSVIGIHPTCAELFTTLRITKSSGLDWKKTSC